MSGLNSSSHVLIQAMCPEDRTEGIEAVSGNSDHTCKCIHWYKHRSQKSTVAEVLLNHFLSINNWSIKYWCNGGKISI